MLRASALLCLLAVSAPALASLPSGDPVAGAEKAKTCASCHGATGNESLDDTYPKLAGQYADYLAKALRDYRSGKRKNPIMAGMAQGLSDQDIDDLSAYFSTQTGEIHDLSDTEAR